MFLISWVITQTLKTDKQCKQLRIAVLPIKTLMTEGPLWGEAPGPATALGPTSPRPAARGQWQRHPSPH